MEQKEINEKYALFNIPQYLIPEYHGDPENFANKFQKCSVLKEVNSSYAAISTTNEKY
ncbi:MAG: hypothetical protein K0R55_2085 [Sporomusa sp.]|jgi:hypothetical protein|nr:hypothetical protein [Sporomusa sp.]